MVVQLLRIYQSVLKLVVIVLALERTKYGPDIISRVPPKCPEPSPSLFFSLLGAWVISKAVYYCDITRKGLSNCESFLEEYAENDKMR